MLRFRLFRPAPSPVSPDIAAHRPGFASALACPAGTVLRFRVFRPGLGPVLPNIAAHSRGSWFYACRRSPVGTSPSFSHLLLVSHSLPARRLSPSPFCVLRFRGIWGEIGPKKPDIAAHRQRRDAAWGKHRCYAWRRAPGFGACGGVRFFDLFQGGVECFLPIVDGGFGCFGALFSSHDSF